MSKRDIDAAILVLTEAWKKLDAGKSEDAERDRRELISAGSILLNGFLVDVNRIANAQEMIADAQTTLARLGLKHG